ncbi:MAG TPA: aspartate aminotransferase family protein [Longimicrobiales bacterium]
MRERNDAPLTIPPDEFRTLGHQLVDRIADLMSTLRGRRVTPPDGPDELRALLGAGAALPARGSDPDALLEEAARLLFDGSTFNAHPRFFGYITAPPSPIGVLGDLLASAVNANCGGWTLSPMASEIEVQTVRWIAELIGFPTTGSGLLVSGGNVANFTGVLAARAALLRDVRARGLADQRLRLYASGETHTWIHKAADIFGIGTDAIHWIPVDRDLRMEADALRAALAEDRRAGFTPLAVVGTAGSVSTGAIDPLDDIADICAEHRVWFHIDGAYGGFAACVPELAPGLGAIGRGDSIAIDPHKWLYAPLEAGCTLVRDPDALRSAFSYHPPYYHFGVEATNFVDLGMQNSRGFRALKVWLALRHAGREGYRRMIADDIELARYLHVVVDEHPELEAVTQSLSITTFRYVPPQLRDSVGRPDTEEQLNKLNENLLDTLQKEGEAFVSNAVIDGRYLLRACVVNFNTTRADIDAVPEIVVRTARRLLVEVAT